MKKKKLRPLGEILLDLEPLLFELADHDVQKGDALALISSWIDIHCPQMIEVYTADDSSPLFFYGHIESLEKFVAKNKKLS